MVKTDHMNRPPQSMTAYAINDIFNEAISIITAKKMYAFLPPFNCCAVANNGDDDDDVDDTQWQYQNFVARKGSYEMPLGMKFMEISLKFCLLFCFFFL